MIKPKLRLNENKQMMWREASERLSNSDRGDRVLKRVVEKGRLNVNKLRKSTR